MNIVDSVEVGTVAHQLALDHGRTAFLYAELLGREFEAEGKGSGSGFLASCLGFDEAALTGIIFPINNRCTNGP